MMTNRILIVALLSGTTLPGCLGEEETPHQMDMMPTMDTSGRVVEGLQVLYKFNEGKGLVVKDQSGVGEPFDLEIDNLVAQKWVEGGGLELTSASVVTSKEVAIKVFGACVQANAVTLEAWIEPANDTQNGTIFTYSKQGQRNATLSVNTTRYAGQVRVSRDDPMMPGTPIINTESIQTPDMLAKPMLQHVIYTRDSSGQVLYLNGGDTKPSSTQPTMPPAEPPPINDLTEWSPTYQLALGNESTGGDPWMGKIYMAAVYCKKLSLIEARQNYDIGPQF